MDSSTLIVLALLVCIVLLVAVGVLYLLENGKNRRLRAAMPPPSASMGVPSAPVARTAAVPSSAPGQPPPPAWMNPAPGMRASEALPRRMTAWAHAYYAQ